MPERTFLPPVAPRLRGRGLPPAVFLAATAPVSDGVVERVERIAPEGCRIFGIVH